MRFTPPSKRDERGVTILIVGVTLLALVAVAALAIDVASLYVARGEAQRAADAAALAGAKMFVSSSFTSAPESWTDSLDALCQDNVATSNAAVNQQAQLAASANSIAGEPASIQNVRCYLDDGHNGINPKVSVTVQRTRPPLFLARIFNIKNGIVSATATAEAYNMSGQDTPIQITGAKPWLIPNCNPYIVVPDAGPHPGNPNCPSTTGFHYDYFVDPADGTIRNDASFIGQRVWLNRILSGAPQPDSPTPPSPIPANGPQLHMYGLRFPASPAPVCPTSGAGCDSIPSGNRYIDGIACGSQLALSCGELIGNGQSIIAENSLDTGTSPTSVGGRCLIHASTDGVVAGFDDGQGQDTFTHNGPPVTITGGDNNPNTGLQGKVNISRSDSVITVPIDNGTNLCPGASCTAITHIVGFMQIAVRRTTGGADLPIVVLNAVGCKSTIAFPPTNPVSAGSISPIIVRLVRTPVTP